MSNRPTYSAPCMTRTFLADTAPRAYDREELLDLPDQSDRNQFVDEPEYADGYGLPIRSLTEDDLRFLRDFILSSAMYVEQLESFLCDSSDDFWKAREDAYRIITALLIRHYEYELEG
jgi:hypothetical protein